MDDASYASKGAARERRAIERADRAGRQARAARAQARSARSWEAELRHGREADLYERATALHRRAADLQAEHAAAHGYPRRDSSIR
jgi:hypothetical protein